MDKQARPKRVAIYCRVSTDEQEENTSLDGQEDDGRKWAEEHGYIVIEVFREIYTGSLYRERKKLSALRELVRAKKIDGVVIRTFDRLSRNQTHFAVLLDEMQHYEVELMCVKEKVDNSPLGQFARMTIALFAEMERAKIYERTTEGRRRAITDKKHISASWKPRYGYAFDDPTPKQRHSVHINEEEAAIVRRIMEEIAGGISLHEIIRRLEADHIPPPHSRWTRHFLIVLAHDERYIGRGAAFTRHGTTARDPLTPINYEIGTYPAIVEKELQERAIAQLARNRQEAARHNPQPEKFLLRAGLLYCGVCGSRMYVNSRHSNLAHSVYTCIAYSDGGNCPGNTVNAAKIDALVWEEIAKLARETWRIREAVQAVLEGMSMQPEKDALHLTRTRLLEDKQRFTNDLKNPNCYGSARDTVLLLLSQTEEQLLRLAQDEAAIEAGEIDIERVRKELRKVLQWCERIEQGESEASQEEKRAFLVMLGTKVKVERTNKRRKEEREIRFSIRIALPELARLLPMHGINDCDTQGSTCYP